MSAVLAEVPCVPALASLLRRACCARLARLAAVLATASPGSETKQTHTTQHRHTRPPRLLLGSEHKHTRTHAIVSSAWRDTRENMYLKGTIFFAFQA